MTKSLSSDRLGVCSWSLQPASANDLLEKLAPTGIKRLQIGLDPIRENPAQWADLQKLATAQGVECISGMFGTVGEDYTTLDSIRRTGGVVPDATWEQNWRNIQANADLAAKMGLKMVAFHAGFLPHEESDPDFAKLLERIQRIAALFDKKGITLGCETGQETAETLRAFLTKAACPNLGVNFDPANMILYDKGDPIAALRVLGPWVKQFHIKDAKRTRIPGTWGEEVVVGTGEVDWKAFSRTLNDLHYNGNCCIEREAGNQRAADIRAGRDYLQTL